MIMSREIFNKILISLSFALFLTPGAGAQSYVSETPYSIFGFGDMMQPGTAYNRTMGGVGIASRNNRFINVLNPAAVTARDTLAFMADYSMASDNKVFRQNDIQSANNTFYINGLVMSFPLFKSSAMMVGITPYSSTGFNYAYTFTDPQTIGYTGNIAYTATGRGTLYDVFAAAGVTFFKRISLGAEGIFTFGDIEKSYATTFVNTGYSGATNGNTATLHGFTGKFGLQYEQPIGAKSKIILGATYRMGTNFSGYIDEYSFASSDTLSYTVDTLAYSPGKVRSASEMGVGITFSHGDSFTLEFDYTRSNWQTTGLDAVKALTTNSKTTSSTSVFTTALSESYRVGMEWVPNRNDIRYYFKRIAYRAGAYYKKDYFKVDGHDINSMGITIGATLPIYRWYNGLTLGFEFGKRGTTQNNLIQETYYNFSIGVDIFDIWFQKPKYD